MSEFEMCLTGNTKLYVTANYFYSHLHYGCHILFIHISIFNSSTTRVFLPK